MAGAPTELVVYGDFNCPFSALASARATQLEHAGIARVSWCAVEHDPGIPEDGVPVRGTVAEELDDELTQVRSLLVAGDGEFELRLPSVRANTRRATELYASTPEPDRAERRTELFGRYWGEGLGLLDDQLEDGAATESGRDRVGRWRSEWLAAGPPMVPIMRLPDGYVSRGLGALRRLAELRDGPSAAG